MTDRRLKVFHTVARLLSFTKAADALHMTQPAVTFQIRQLEEHLNTRLFDRTHNRVALTDVGEVVYNYAEKIFGLYLQMENTVKEMTGEISGILTLGASTTVAEYMLPSLIGSFKQHYPNVNIRLRVSNSEGIISMLENNNIDLAVIESSVSNKNLIVEECRSDELVVIVYPSHPLAEKKTLTAQEIYQYAFVCREEGSGTREVVKQYFADQGIDLNMLNVCLELGSPEAVKGAVEAGMGISILSLSTVNKELQLGSLVVIPLDPPLLRPLSFVRQRHKFRLQAMEELLTYAKNDCEKRRLERKQTFPTGT